MTSPQERINEKLRETESIIEEAEKELVANNVPEYLKQLQFSSFEKRLETIKNEKSTIFDLDGREEITLTMKPANLPSGQISLRDFSLIVGGFQELSDSIANTIYNQPSEKGKIPKDILDRNELILKETRAGSFKAVLDLKHPRQGTLDYPEPTRTIDELFNLFESSNDDNQLAEVISVLGPRTLKNYTNWTKTISEQGTPIDIEWNSAYKEKSSIDIDINKAEKIYKTLNNFSDSREEDISVTGVLSGVNVRTETFELISEAGERISGRISKEAISSFINPNFKKNYIVDLIKVIITGPGYKEKISWTLKNLHEKI